MGRKKIERRLDAIEGVFDSYEEDLHRMQEVIDEAVRELTWMMARRQVVMAGIPGLYLQVPIVQLDPELPLPKYAEDGDAGMDLRAREDMDIPPGQRALMPTGIALAIPEGFGGFIHPRSGLAVKHGVTVLNAPGTIDAGYRGEIKVPLYNADLCDWHTVRRGDRIAQLVFQQVAKAELQVVDELPPSERGAGGFGSTGTN